MKCNHDHWGDPALGQVEEVWCRQSLEWVGIKGGSDWVGIVAREAGCKEREALTCTGHFEVGSLWVPASNP